MTELAIWFPTVVALIGVGAGWGAMKQEGRNQNRELKRQGEDIQELKEMLIGHNGMPNYVTRVEWKETWDKFLKRCHERHKGL